MTDPILCVPNKIGPLPLIKENFLSEFETDRDRYAARTNLGVYSKEEINTLIEVLNSNINNVIEELDGYSISEKIHVGDTIITYSSDGITLTQYTISYNTETKKYDVADSITITINQASTSVAGLMSAEDKTRLDAIYEGNLDLPTPVITGTWTFYNNSGTEISSSELSPTPNATNPTIENGYKASFNGTYMWTHEDDKKDPTQVQDGSNWTDLPESGVSSEVYDSGLLSSSTTIKIGIQAEKTGLMVDGENVQPASGYDTTTASRTVTFSNRIYYGTSSNDTINESTIKSLTNTLGSKSRTISGITATTEEYYIYAYPTSLGTLTSIIQDGATPVLTAFTQSTLTITNGASASINLYVYRSNNKGAFTNVSLQFS